ncbi:MAG: tRNA 2-thiocytidine(32) synthetase TtcA [Bdellovibrionaceae bacterium]|nr:tRNA 2-thiocytidine(32) synthetase TtcA [Pseudobdellovibrionaceae bacterium]MBX3035029.1 tRNA 2-thiocytidine(32) synthetase TtcA [Pseudobdellovibrionaceae bacterium]
MSVDFEHPLAIKIRKDIVRAVADYDMIEAGDRLMVCVSGGKDSSVLLALLTEIGRRAERKFELEAVILDQKQPGFDAGEFQAWVEKLGVKLTILERDTYSIVTEKIKEGTFCSLCSRLRRAILYDHAVDNGFTKVVLGHHRDDLIETALLNLFYTGKMASMPPKLRSDDGRNILVRPLAYVQEADVAQLAKEWNVPILPCNLCGSQEGLKRKRMKKLMRDLENEIPHIGSSVMTALANVKPSQLLDRELWDFSSFGLRE